MLEPKKEETAKKTELKKTDDGEKKADNTNDSGKRKLFLWMVAGAYLIYTAFELVNSYLTKEEGSSVGFCIAGVVFGVIGAYLIFLVIRDYAREGKKRKEEAALASEEGQEGQEPRNGETELPDAGSQKNGGQPQKMSISQRARLVQSREEEESQEREDEKE